MVVMDLFEDPINFVAVWQIHAADVVVFHGDGPCVADWNKSKQIDVFERVSNSSNHCFYKMVIDVSCAMVGYVLRIG